MNVRVGAPVQTDTVISKLKNGDSYEGIKVVIYDPGQLTFIWMI